MKFFPHVAHEASKGIASRLGLFARSRHGGGRQLSHGRSLDDVGDADEEWRGNATQQDNETLGRCRRGDGNCLLSVRSCLGAAEKGSRIQNARNLIFLLKTRELGPVRGYDDSFKLSNLDSGVHGSWMRKTSLKIGRSQGGTGSAPNAPAMASFSAAVFRMRPIKIQDAGGEGLLLILAHQRR